MIKILAGNTKRFGAIQFDTSMEELEETMDAHAYEVMSQTLMDQSTLYFPDGRVVEYTLDEKSGTVWKRIGKIKNRCGAV